MSSTRPSKLRVFQKREHFGEWVLFVLIVES